MARFTNISKKGLEINVSDETLKDTLMDLHNYAAMAIMCMEDADADKVHDAINMV
jgi:hypothetical protein